MCMCVHAPCTYICTYICVCMCREAVTLTMPTPHHHHSTRSELLVAKSVAVLSRFLQNPFHSTPASGEWSIPTSHPVLSCPHLPPCAIMSPPPTLCYHVPTSHPVLSCPHLPPCAIMSPPPTLCYHVPTSHPVRWCMYVCSHILKVPFEGSEGSGIVYIWIGKETTQEEAIHAEQMGRTMFEVSASPTPHTHHSPTPHTHHSPIPHTHHSPIPHTHHFPHHLSHPIQILGL